MRESDTIAAISTAPVPAAIGILRLSGPRAVEYVEKIFRTRDGRPLSQRGSLEEMYQIRKPMYEHFADYMVSNNSSAVEAAKHIIKILEDAL